ncbi:MAG: S8 family serine peptidase [Phycisphaerales bacterium JB063]
MQRWPVLVLWMALSAGVLGTVAWFHAQPGAVSAQDRAPDRDGPLDQAEPALDDGLTPAVRPVGPEGRGGGNVRETIGWEQARERLGREMPTGRGIAAGLVEAGEAYAPNSRDQRLRGVNFILQSGSTGNSPHASGAARNAFGQQAPAPGVARVHCFSVSHWMGEGYLRTGTTDPPDDWNESRVFNHSWIAEQADFAPQVIRRVDWLADEKDILCCVGVNNGNTQVPQLLASAYNTISVGVISGDHSRGTTRIEITGRVKPELVAPGSLTSWSTAVVTGCVAVLLERADEIEERDPDAPDANAQRSEVVKALLMGGAFKPLGWAPNVGEPLDPRWGAGIVDIDRALLMMDAGHTEPGDTNKRYGWSFTDIDRAGVDDYTFNITADQGEACFALVWHRHVVGGGATVRNNATGEARAVWNNTTILADLDLELVRLNDVGEEESVQISRSAVDNVEMVYVESLPAGRYTVRVTRGNDREDDAWEYALAWRIEAE